MIGRLVRPDGTSAVIYDAAHDSELTLVLLRAIATEQDTGRLRFRRAPGARIDTALQSLVLTGEQSNTCLVYGEDAILKLFRRLTPGANPDLEVTSALARIGSAHIAQPFGWIEMDLEGTATTVAILSEYLRTASDGWSLAQTSVRDLYAGEGVRPEEAGGDFAGEARRLGAATAEIHCDLADAFGTSELEPDAIAELAAQMREKLESARAVVPALARHADLVQTAFDDFAKLDKPMRVQRIHGDYHLGQVVRTEAGWIVLDFEGEPATPLAAAARADVAAARRRGHAPLLRLRRPRATDRPSPRRQAAWRRVRLDAAQPRRVLRRLRGGQRRRPAPGGGHAARLRTGEGRLRGRLRGASPAVLAAHTA